MFSRKTIALPLFALAFFSCKDDALPKPASYLSLEYPVANYENFDENCPFTFEMNDIAVVQNKGNCDFTLNYPKMKATIYLTYKPVTGDVEAHLKDAQQLTYKHTIKADDIVEQPFVNSDDKVYGMMYKVGGNAATNALFYATDSTKHFVTGSVYFYAKPNFDSILPAANYMRNDMKMLMETLRWKQ